jgi:hypothetical protein
VHWLQGAPGRLPNGPSEASTVPMLALNRPRVGQQVRHSGLPKYLLLDRVVSPGRDCVVDVRLVEPRDSARSPNQW